MPNKLIEKIILSISKILNEPIKNVTMASKSDDFNRWDSLNHVRIMLEIEKITKKKIKTSKISELNSVKAISEYLS
jgi:acyl carrier protein